MVEERVDTIGAYDAMAPYYAEYSVNRKNYLESIDDIVIKAVLKKNRLLDIGSGDGRRLAKIKKMANLVDIIAIEPSEKMVSICREKAKVTVIKATAEEISELDIGQFDAVTALWNVFGHIPDRRGRIKALENIRSTLAPDGILILDVNNRHNASAYGYFSVIKRMLIDTFNFKEERGDAYYEWKVSDKVFHSKGHLFTSSEIEDLFNMTGFKIKSRFSVNYSSGEVSSNKYQGQLLYILGR